MAEDRSRREKDQRTKSWNAARRKFREKNPEHRGKKLRQWPLVA